MTSINKKRKAKNSNIRGGAEAQKDIKCKRIWYFTKAIRTENKKIREEEQDADSN